MMFLKHVSNIISLLLKLVPTSAYSQRLIGKPESMTLNAYVLAVILRLGLAV